MRSSRTRTALYRVAAALVGTAVVAVGGVGPALAAADDPTLLVPSSVDLGEASPGTSVALPVRLHVSGDRPAEGLTFVFGGYRAGVDLREYGDCTYYRSKPKNGDSPSLRGAVCHLTGTLRPGTNYEVVAPDEAPVRLDVAADAQGPWLQVSGFEVNPAGHVSWQQSLLQRDSADGLLSVTKGSGAPLRVVERGTDAPASDWRPNHTSFRLRTAANPYDFEVLGATAAGEVGDTVAVSVGVRNHGPSTVATDEHGPSFRLRVAVPAGAKAVGVPRYCVPASADWSWDTEAAKVGHPRFVCQFAALRAGAEVAFPFELELTQVVAGAAGALQLDLGDRPDSKATNNTAKIVLNPASGPSPSPADDGTGGAGGGLPVTGGDVTGLTLVAAMFLALGTGLFIASRRRA